MAWRKEQLRAKALAVHYLQPIGLGRLAMAPRTRAQFITERPCRGLECWAVLGGLLKRTELSLRKILFDNIKTYIFLENQDQINRFTIDRTKIPGII